MTRRRLFGAAIAIAALCVVVAVLFAMGRTSVKNEWAVKFPKQPHTAREIRGLVDNLYQYHENMIPSFVPQSGWEDELCAADVSGAVNFLLGEERLDTSVPAWLFSQVHAKHLNKVYDRSEDFAIKEGIRVVETRDRTFWLSRILETVGHGAKLTSDRLYIMGYHYQETQSDHRIIAAGADLNSHLMLILGRYDGTWWGYHMFHSRDRQEGSPFRIDNIGSCDESERCMPNLFDGVYIWEVKNSRMAARGAGAPIALMQNVQPYSSAIFFMRLTGTFGISYYLDTVFSFLAGRGENFPRVADVSGVLVDVINPHESGQWFGQIMGFYREEPVRWHSGSSVRGKYGKEFQCVEYINRFYARRLGHHNMTISGAADTYWYAAEAKELVRFKNGSSEKPRVGDILTFDPPGLDDKDPGHVAIVYEVAQDRVCVVQQNTVPWRECLQMERRGSGWYVANINPMLTCVGWSRRE